jgi:ribosomal-protein-alanine N-acetyltransferase
VEGRGLKPQDEAIRDSSTLVVRRTARADLADVLAILRESPGAAQWSEGGLAASVSSGTAWVAERNGHAAGFLVGRCVTDEFEILNMAVAPAHRRHGIGKRLVSEALGWSRMAGARRAYLEVRASNVSAISLYVRCGFSECGRRASYYKTPVEDAILFSLNVNIYYRV